MPKEPSSASEEQEVIWIANYVVLRQGGQAQPGHRWGDWTCQPTRGEQCSTLLSGRTGLLQFFQISYIMKNANLSLFYKVK